MSGHKLSSIELREIEKFAVGPQPCAWDPKVAICHDALHRQQCKTLIAFLECQYNVALAQNKFTNSSASGPNAEDFQFELSDLKLQELVGSEPVLSIKFQGSISGAPLSPPRFILRRACFKGGGDKLVPLHRDISSATFNLLLSSAEEYAGGRFVYVADERVSWLSLGAGSGVAFNDALLHCVSPLLRGVRYSLLVSWEGMHKVVSSDVGMNRGFPMTSDELLFRSSRR